MTPKDVIAIANDGHGLPDFVFCVINQLLVEGRKTAYIDDMKIRILQSTLKQQLEEAASVQGVVLAFRITTRKAGISKCRSTYPATIRVTLFALRGSGERRNRKPQLLPWLHK